jgi:hypothetical protein
MNNNNNFTNHNFTTSEKVNSNSANSYSSQIVDKLQMEYDALVGESDIIAVKLFSLEYPEYSVRKFK